MSFRSSRTTVRKRTATISVPMNENADCSSTANHPRKRPFAPAMLSNCTNGPGSFQYLKPIRSWLGPPPRSNTIPRIISPVIAMTLMELSHEKPESELRSPSYIIGRTYAKMNSHSPYTPAPNRLMIRTTTKHIVTQTALFTSVVQNFIKTDAALSSAGRRIVQLYP